MRRDEHSLSARLKLRCMSAGCHRLGRTDVIVTYRRCLRRATRVSLILAPCMLVVL